MTDKIQKLERFVLDDPLKQRATTKDIAGYVDENGCWICDTYASKYRSDGTRGYYPITRVFDGVKRIRSIHQYAYETYSNNKIPEGLVVRHKCDNPFCINPEHLELGTHKDNSNDRVERDRSAKGENNGNSKLSNDSRKEIENLILEGKESLTNIAKSYMISIPRVCQIKKEMKL